MTCAKSGSVDAVRMLIEYGAAVNAKEPAQNQTALMWAAAEHHPDVVKALIDAHADLKAHTKQGFTAMHFAAREGDLESVKLLLAAGVDVNILTQAEGRSERAVTAAQAAGFRKTVGAHRLHSAAGGDGAGPGGPGAVPAGSWRRPQQRRGGLYAAALGVQPMGKLHRESGVRF